MDYIVTHTTTKTYHAAGANKALSHCRTNRQRSTNRVILSVILNILRLDFEFFNI